MGPSYLWVRWEIPFKKIPYTIHLINYMTCVYKGIHPAYFQYVRCYYLKVFVNSVVIIA